MVQSVEVFSGAIHRRLGSALGGAPSWAQAGLRRPADLDATIRLAGAGIGVLIVLWAVPAGLAGLAARPAGPHRHPIARRRHGTWRVSPWLPRAPATAAPPAPAPCPTEPPTVTPARPPP